jgi:hypothetical protein
MVSARLLSVSRAAVAGIVCLILIQLVAKPEDLMNWLGALAVSGSIVWFVLEVFQGPEIVDDRIVAQDLFLEVLAGQEGEKK